MGLVGLRLGTDSGKKQEADDGFDASLLTGIVWGEAMSQKFNKNLLALHPAGPVDERRKQLQANNSAPCSDWCRAGGAAFLRLWNEAFDIQQRFNRSCSSAAAAIHRGLSFRFRRTAVRFGGAS